MSTVVKFICEICTTLTKNAQKYWHGPLTKTTLPFFRLTTCLRNIFKKNINAYKYARQSVQTAISGDENNPPQKTDLVLQINIHAFFLYAAFLKVLEKVDF